MTEEEKKFVKRVVLYRGTENYPAMLWLQAAFLTSGNGLWSFVCVS